MTAICAAIQYLVDRGEMEHVTEVETKVRYTSTEVDEFIVRTGRKRWRITAEQIE